MIKNMKIDFNAKFSITGFFSLVFIFFGIIFFLFKGFQVGLGFTGGAELIVNFDGYETNDENIKKELKFFLDESGFEYSEIRSLGKNEIILIMPYSDNKWIEEIDKDINNDGKIYGFCSNESFSDKDNCKTGLTEEDIRNQLNQKTSFKLTSFEGTSGEISKEARLKAIQAIGIAMLLIGFYIIIRFDWYSALGSIAALVHDILIVTSTLIFFNYTFDENIVAAFLIIIGYSLNDTIVVFDRVRENIVSYSNMKLTDIINLSLNETLNRTIVTSITTLFVVITVFIFGGESLRSSSFSLIIGIISGTYSSIFIATPIMTFLRNKYYKEQDEKEEQWQ